MVWISNPPKWTLIWIAWLALYGLHILFILEQLHTPWWILTTESQFVILISGFLTAVGLHYASRFRFYSFYENYKRFILLDVLAILMIPILYPNELAVPLVVGILILQTFCTLFMGDLIKLKTWSLKMPWYQGDIDTPIEKSIHKPFSLFCDGKAVDASLYAIEYPNIIFRVGSVAKKSLETKSWHLAGHHGQTKLLPQSCQQLTKSETPTAFLIAFRIQATTLKSTLELKHFFEVLRLSGGYNL